MKSLRRIIVFGLIFLCTFSCKQHQKNELVRAGILNFQVNYIEDKAGAIPTSILPKKMTLVISDKVILNTIEGFLDQFVLSYIADLRTEKVITSLKIFDKHYFHQGKKGELPVGINSLDGMNLELTAEEKQFLGFQASLYKLEIPELPVMDIWYTSELNISNPNITTPYRDINGILLQFYAELSVLKMYITASQYEEKEINTEIFTIPEKYQKISREKMEKILEELFK